MTSSCVFRGNKWWICMYIMSRLMVINIRLGHLFAISKLAKSQLFILFLFPGLWSCITLYIGKFLACTDWPVLSWWFLMIWRQIGTRPSHADSAMTIQCHMNTKNNDRQYDNFVVTGGTVSCHYDNLRCHQWRQSCEIDDLLFQRTILRNIYTSCAYCITAIKQTMAGS